MPNHHHAHIQDIARTAFSFALLAFVALATFATTIAWAAPTPNANDGTDSPRLTATLATADGGHEVCGDGDVRLVCTIAYEGLEPNTRYKASATLLDTATDKPIEDETGKAIEATHVFTPDREGGSVEVEIPLDGKRNLGRAIGATATIRSGDRVVATSVASGDPVRIPKLSAKATDTATGKNVAMAADGTEITDEVTYECLCPGTTYVLHGTVRDAETGAMLMGDERRPTDGTDVTREFTPTDSSGTVTMSYQFDASALEGHTVTITEVLRKADNDPALATYDGIASHNEIRFPSLSSMAVLAREGTTIRDVLSYANLTPDREYVAAGTLRVATDGEPDGAVVTDEYGNPLTASATFTPDDTEGTVELRFDLATTDLPGCDLVTSEQITLDEHVVASNASTRPVSMPRASVTLVDARSGLREARATEGTRLVATVAYENLPEGEGGIIEVTLVDAQTGDSLLTADAHAATVKAELDASETSGSVELPLVMDARALAGRTVTARAYVHVGGDIIRAAADEGSVVRFPKLDSTLCDEKSGAHVTSGDGTAILNDAISYTGLMPGAQHTLKVTLVDATTGDAVDDGTSSAGVSFVPDSAEGTILVSVPLAAKGLYGKTVASTETLTCENMVTAEHAGGRSDASRVRVAKASAVARSAASSDHEVPVTERAEVNVVVSCENLQPGLEHEVTCTLLDADDDKGLGTDGTQATWVSTIAPESENTSVEAKLSIDARELAGRSVVVRAAVALDGHELASCEANTLRIPSVATNPHAEGSESTEVAASQRTKVVDSVSYTNLVPGKEYVIEGELVDARTGKPAVATVRTQGQAPAKQNAATPSTTKAQATSPEPADATAVWVTEDGSYHLDERCGLASGTKRQTTLGIAKATGKTRCQAEAASTVAQHTESAPAANAGTQTEGRQEERPARATARFTPTEPNGTVDVTYELDTTSLDGTKLVALETLSRDGHVVVDSRDHTDGRQEVTVTNRPASGSAVSGSESMGQTGTGILPLVTIGMGIALAVGGALVARTLDEEDGEDGK